MRRLPEVVFWIAFILPLAAQTAPPADATQAAPAVSAPTASAAAPLRHLPRSLRPSRRLAAGSILDTAFAAV